MEDKVKKRISSCEKRLREMADDESDGEFVESLRQQLELWKRKKRFTESVIQLGYLPCDVPGDGNCGLWTLAALQSGCFIRTATSTKEKTFALRQDIARGSVVGGSWSGWRPKC